MKNFIYIVSILMFFVCCTKDLTGIEKSFKNSIAANGWDDYRTMELKRISVLEYHEIENIIFRDELNNIETQKLIVDRALNAYNQDSTSVNLKERVDLERKRLMRLKNKLADFPRVDSSEIALQYYSLSYVASKNDIEVENTVYLLANKRDSLLAGSPEEIDDRQLRIAAKGLGYTFN
ncbi:hypothetical protein MG296_10740 [Flavobacteriaceae bacterium TK19130]|nr:hypothetical protein [Thermobacterium salinum]